MVTRGGRQAAREERKVGNSWDTRYHGRHIDRVSLSEVVRIDRQRPLLDAASASAPTDTEDQTIFGTAGGETLTDDCCHICQQSFAEGDDIKLLSCNHKFHSKEINDWLERKNTCPICSI